MSGAGTGKGLLVRCICLVAFGREPHAVTLGMEKAEPEKRIATELMQGRPALYLDNINKSQFRSDLLASALTERPALVRVLGYSKMVQLNATALVLLTGNGLTVVEDLARRFITVKLDARLEDPENRPFRDNIKKKIKARRNELLIAALTILRWGRLTGKLAPGRSMGSFEQWGEWVRDPLLALGCQDPVDRIAEAKQLDADRQQIAELFRKWWEKHQDKAMVANGLDDEVKQIIDPQGRSRQFLASEVQALSGTRAAGFTLLAQKPSSRWGKITYALRKDSDA